MSEKTEDNKKNVKVDVNNYGGLFGNFFTFLLIYVILQFCGCDISGYIGKEVGHAVNSYHSTRAIHPHDIR